MHGSTKRCVLAGVVLLAFVLIVCASALRRMQHRARLNRMPKVIASLSHVLETLVNERARPLERRLVKGDPTSWRELDVREHPWLLGEAARHADASPQWEDMVRTDAWEPALRSEVRRPRRRLEFRTTSAGPDGRFDTGDDIGCTTEEPAAHPLPLAPV